MQRSVLIKRLILLNVKSIQEGLLQLLNYTDVHVPQRRCFSMVLFLPNVEEFDYLENVDGNIVVKSQPINIMEKAIEFCNIHSVDSTSSKVFVNNIDFKVKQNELWDFFEHFGKVLQVYIVKDRKTKRSRGFGFVVFSSPFDAKKAMNGKKYELKLNGRLMQVLPAVKKKKNINNKQDTTEKVELKLKKAADYFTENNIEVKLEEEIAVSEKNSFQLIDKLCDDMLLEIFSYMDMCTRLRLELVCKKWHRIAVQSWEQITHLCFKNVFNLSHTHACLTDRILISILNKNCVNLKSIDLSASPYLITHSSLLKISNTCRNLEELNLSYVLLKKDSTKILGKNLTNLKIIRMSHCLNIGEKGYWWLFKDQVRLDELQITDTSRLIGNCIYMLPSTVKNINFESCTELNDVGLKHLSNRCPNILYLDLSFCVNISDDGLNLLLRKCHHVIELKLKGLGRNMSTNGFDSITQLKQLVELDISRNIAVNDVLLQNVAMNCKNLNKLNIEACHGDITSNGIKHLCFCPKLIELNISYIVYVTDECVTELAMEGNLRKFIIRSSPEISDHCVASCVQYLDNLELLDLSGCFYISDELPKYLDFKSINRSPSKKLHIILGGTQVTEDGMKILQEKLKSSLVTMQNFQVGMLRNDRDPTLVRSFFPESSDEEEEEVTHDLIVLKDEIELDAKENYPCFDEDGERLWVCVPNEESVSKDSLPAKNVSSTCDIQLSSTVRNSSIVEGEKEDEENWDNELEEGHVWNFPTESLDKFAGFCDDYDDFLENDDLSRLELIG